MYSSTLSLTSALDGVGGQRHAPTPLPPGKTRYPLDRRLGGPQGRSEQVWKISPPPGFDHRTVQLVASHYECLNQTSSLSKSHLVPRHVCYRNARRKSDTVRHTISLSAGADSWACLLMCCGRAVQNAVGNNFTGLLHI
jgi:hypothetical protein